MPMLRFIRNRRLQRDLAALPLCPLPRPLDLSSARRVLVFAPHPDDETLGCGGTLAKLAGHCAIKAVLVTDGSGAGELPEGTANIRQAEFRSALAQLGVMDTIFLNQPDGNFYGSPHLAEDIVNLLGDFRPDWVFLPPPIDYHRDHLLISAFLAPLCRAADSVKQLVFYEVWSPVPATHVVDITGEWALKAAALGEHRTALACGDYARAIEGLNRFRGLYLGVDRMAEAFMVEVATERELFDRLLGLCVKLAKT
jgi:N-acetylglucosamine malate deacetylase 1